MLTSAPVGLDRGSRSYDRAHSPSYGSMPRGGPPPIGGTGPGGMGGDIRGGPPPADHRGQGSDYQRGPPGGDYRSGPPPTDYRSGPPTDFRGALPGDFRGGAAPNDVRGAPFDQRGLPPGDYRGGPPPSDPRGPPSNMHGGPSGVQGPGMGGPGLGASGPGGPGAGGMRGDSRDFDARGGPPPNMQSFPGPGGPPGPAGMRGEPPRDPRDFDPRNGPAAGRQGAGSAPQQANTGSGSNVEEVLAKLLQQVNSSGGVSALSSEATRAQVLAALNQNPQLVQALVQKMPSGQAQQQQQQQQQVEILESQLTTRFTEENGMGPTLTAASARCASPPRALYTQASFCFFVPRSHTHTHAHANIHTHTRRCSSSSHSSSSNSRYITGYLCVLPCACGSV